MFGRPFFAFHAAIVPKARLTLVQTAFWENDDQGSGWMSANRKLSAGWRKIAITLIEVEKGEVKAQACDNAWYLKLTRRG